MFGLSVRKALALPLFLLVLTGCGQDLSQGSAAWEARARECSSTDDVFVRIECFTDLAVAESDVTVCGAAAHEGVRYQCYAIFAERQDDLDACDLIPTDSDELVTLRSGCISDVAVLRKNSGLCGRVETVGIRDGCYLKIAEAIDDRALCEKIIDEGVKSTCSGDTVWVN